MPNSAELHERRIAAVPRGVSHATAIYAKRAKNAEIWSEDGKRRGVWSRETVENPVGPQHFERFAFSRGNRLLERRQLGARIGARGHRRKNRPVG